MKKTSACKDMLQHISDSYEKTKSLQKTASELGIGYAKVRKVLITLGKYETNFSKQVALKRNMGQSIQEIADELNTTTNRVTAYLPYERLIYNVEEETVDAKKSKEYRVRNNITKDNFVYNGVCNNHPLSSERGLDMKISSAKEKHEITAVYLHLELGDGYLSDTQKRMLKRYGESSTGESISRDILIPSDMPLHNLHYAIQKVFGWQNSHLRKFCLSDERYQKITGGTVKGWSHMVGILFQPPGECETDIFWDDDYRSGSIKAWLKKKYQGPYVYGGYLEELKEAKEDIQTLLDRYPMMEVSEPFRVPLKILKKAPLIELTLQEMNDSIIIENGTESLLERLEVAKIIAAEHEGFNENGYFPITRELIYNYDFGDNWNVYITKKDNCNELLENGDISKGELEVAMSIVVDKHVPVCIHKDGINVVDDVGGLCGFADFLEKIYENEDKHEVSDYIAWARSMGWNAKKTSCKGML